MSTTARSTHGRGGSRQSCDGWAGCRGGYGFCDVIELDSRLLAGRYQLEGVLGRGGMAVVYAARDRRLDRRVAVKVVPLAATESVVRHRFVREARSAAGLAHPNVVAVFDAGEADGHLYLVMEFVDGRTLADLLAEGGPFESAKATAVASAVLAALGHAHAAGIVHRDVKPSNIMMSDDGTVKLLDFGIARRFDDLAGVVTAVGQVVGTPKYLAPEQIEGGAASPATDVYAVGVVLFEMLTGSAPFDGDTPVAAAFARLHTPAPDVRVRRHDVPADLAAVIDKAMARDPADRFTDAAAMQAALDVIDPASSTAVSEPPAVTLEPTQVLPSSYRPPGRRRRWIAAVAALVLAAGLVAWYAAGQDPSVSPPPATTPATAATTTLAPAVSPPSTIDGVIAALQADPAAYGQHTADIVNELVLIQQGDAPSERAATLLDTVTAWTANGEVTPATQALLEPVLRPLITTQPDAADDNGNGNDNGGGGNGNGRNNGRGKNG